MKTNRFFLAVLAVSLSIFANAQKEIPDSATELLFDSNGAFTRITATTEDVSAKLITQNPLIDDVPWKKTVLRVIDLREEQNKALYYPSTDISEDTQKNLFAILFYNFLKGKLTGYLDSHGNFDQTFVPLFTPENEVNAADSIRFPYLKAGYFEDLQGDEYGMINQITESCVKYYIQEVWYFDKHTSTFKSKILAIAPIFDKKYNVQRLGGYEEDDRPSGVWFWFPYEKVRPFLQEEFIKMSGRNIQALLNFDDFFTTRQFYSYIVKDYDLQGKDIDMKLNMDDADPRKPIRIKEEQDKVEHQILDFEQDLWNY
ncbi:MAG: gliding motility protein GldN [Paludibacteraceae bacterium]|nr:gliding motility protein GldN [Paludibacteraceae bacterium]